MIRRPPRLAISGDTLYVGGLFTQAGGEPAKSVARWNGITWSALGEGLDGWAYALTLLGSDLIAGGGFYIRGTDCNVARWNGTTWSPMGYGPTVRALAVSGNNLYVGGSADIESAGSVYVSRWDGNAWGRLGADLSGDTLTSVYALAVSGSNVYAAGHFMTAGEVPAANIAHWDGHTWSSLGTGITGDRNTWGYALALSGADLYVGGRFVRAGGKPSAKVARARVSFVPDQLALQFNVPEAPNNTLSFSGVPGFPYLVQYATNLATGSWTTFSTNPPAADGVGTVLDPAATSPQRFYRVGYEE
ncbi:MAG TPA: hypothetical protein DCE44_22335 [Verrucomicrobiales bacterium]|nr:hypothetical protein [Verrucomicrobiales bacterium]